ncbi:MAG: glycosyltransferase family 2 protein [Thermodesulfobacteriota bacterium]
MKSSISIVLPAYNEEALIGRMLDHVVDVMSTNRFDYEILVVDDGSIDRTAERVAGKTKTNPRIRLVRHETNRGCGAAMFTGFAAAQKDLVFLTDADMQFDVSEIVSLLAVMDKADIAAGYRCPRRESLIRRINALGWHMLVTVFFGKTARDINCAFKLIRKPVIDAVKKDIISRGAMFSAEFLIRARRAGFVIENVPVRGHRPRTAGKATGAHPAVIAKSLVELVRLRWTMHKTP